MPVPWRWLFLFFLWAVLHTLLGLPAAAFSVIYSPCYVVYGLTIGIKKIIELAIHYVTRVQGSEQKPAVTHPLQPSLFLLMKAVAHAGIPLKLIEVITNEPLNYLKSLFKDGVVIHHDIRFGDIGLDKLLKSW